MFFEASAFNQAPNFDTSSVVTMKCESPYWKTACSVHALGLDLMRRGVARKQGLADNMRLQELSAIACADMFRVAQSFNQSLHFDTSGVTNFDRESCPEAAACDVHVHTGGEGEELLRRTALVAQLCLCCSHVNHDSVCRDVRWRGVIQPIVELQHKQRDSDAL